MADPHFAPDHATARSMFLEAASAAGGHLEILDPGVKGPSDETLAIDLAWFGSETPRRVLLHSSGLHGVEGFAGSAIQCRYLKGRLNVPDDGALVFAHVLNPHGMAWLRRVN